ncbi:MAG: Ni/Fe hydrogenase subunit alpha [Bryobacteraceae bacterium]|nr:Ni/Fe hydrogenase subunit alpha [Bryobacteraceae bacterium]
MGRTLTIEHVTRIEGHARISIHLDEDGRVSSAQLHVTQLRGFEKFVEGRPYYEMPAITARICGICPVSHLLASAKACEAIMAVQPPPAAVKLRELLHCGQIVQSHALSFFHLSSPDLLLGMDADPAARNVFGLLEQYPELARSGIALRKFGQQVIERVGGERIHPPRIVPGGLGQPLAAEARDAILEQLPVARATARHTLQFFKERIESFSEQIEAFDDTPTLFAALTDAAGNVQWYSGTVRFADAEGNLLAALEEPAAYPSLIGEAVLPHSYLKAPYYKPFGLAGGMYRVGPLARLNVAERFGTPEADHELEQFRRRFGRRPRSAFLYHYARLLEVLHALERMQALLEDPEILSPRVRAFAGVNALRGVGIIEAPRGLLIHDYEVDPSGTVQRVNLIVATGHNNLAIGEGLCQVARRYVDGNRLSEGMLNRVSALVRAYDPCLSCSTHAAGLPPLEIRLLDARGELVDCLRY